MKQFSLKGKKGITLIALVVTIVVLIILVGISINLVIGDNGIITIAKKVKENTEVSQEEEKDILNKYADYIDGQENGQEKNEQQNITLEEFAKDPTKYKNSEQDTSNNDIAIGTDGSSVNLNLWSYEITESGAGITLGTYSDSMNRIPGYKNENITSEGKIIGSVPKYIYIDSLKKTLPVVLMDGTFAYCESLKIAPTIPDSVTTMYLTFIGCTSLASINIPSSVTEIGYNAFSDCTSLTSINIPSSVTTIGGYAFCRCTSLESVSFSIPSSVTAIGGSTFYNCTSLTSINIPSSVTTIGGYAFCRCTSLASINIPDSVTKIGYCVFSAWTSQQTINIQSSSVPSGWASDWKDDCNAKINYGVDM